jgi:hypothetical protein
MQGKSVDDVRMSKAEIDELFAGGSPRRLILKLLAGGAVTGLVGVARAGGVDAHRRHSRHSHTHAHTGHEAGSNHTRR